MGYYSDYSIEVEYKKGINIEEIEETLINFVNSKYPYLLNASLEAHEQKWYSAESDIKEFSKLYPNMVFIINQIGEDAKYYKIYIKNGKSFITEGKIIFEPFDVKKLK